MNINMNIDTLKALREHVVANRTTNALLIIDATIEDLTPADEDEDDIPRDHAKCQYCGRIGLIDYVARRECCDEDLTPDKKQKVDGHPACECGRANQHGDV